MQKPVREDGHKFKLKTAPNLTHTQKISKKKVLSNFFEAEMQMRGFTTTKDSTDTHRQSTEKPKIEREAAE